MYSDGEEFVGRSGRRPRRRDGLPRSAQGSGVASGLSRPADWPAPGQGSSGFWGVAGRSESRDWRSGEGGEGVRRALSSQYGALGAESGARPLKPPPGFLSEVPPGTSPPGPLALSRGDGIESASVFASGLRLTVRQEQIPFEHGKGDEFFSPADDYTPGLNKKLVAGKPKQVADDIAYVFQQILPPRYWQTVSGFSKAYAINKKAGEDVNADKALEDRHPRYLGKGKQRPWNPLWVREVRELEPVRYAMEMVRLGTVLGGDEEPVLSDHSLLSEVARHC
ncbi:hypothetical protein CYMTET_16806 [Cymbomonas tetramitiformis]|uniref:Uncharacterized protein n=1 Tax=Cymbomonas tetramitiformis TaxID=36881 RepID=A0AAE0L7Y6_9CHLO|nr:hypothetical protein CYMTET_16806 [Cymbomonas tetramitiformis]